MHADVTGAARLARGGDDKMKHGARALHGYHG